MGLQQLPDELLLSLTEERPCRDVQIRQLSCLLSPSLPSPSTVVIYGPPSTGKTTTTASHLQKQNLRHTIVRCRECVTGRHLLEKIVGQVYQTLQEEGRDGTFGGRCESIGTLAVHLQRALSNGEKFVLVLDEIDKQREAPPTLLPALARMGETIPNLTVVLIVQHTPPRFLRQTGTAHVHFAPYSRNQAVHILSQSPEDIFLKPYLDDHDYDDDTHEEEKAWLWPRFVSAVWDSLAQNSARDLVAFRELCTKLWRPFVEPIVKGDFGTRDFSRLLVSQRRLFQDENVLLESIVPQTADASVMQTAQGHELPYFAKWLLVSAYLASFNPARMDALYFMKSSEKKRKKKGGGTARSGGGKTSQNRKTPRHLLAPSAFTLDRLLSILHAILPHDLRTTIDVYTQVATLASLRLLSRSGGIGNSDPLEPGTKMRVGFPVTWEYVQALARSLDFNLIDYIAE
ncbi:Hypothetical protein R9X50_00715200 [Acrodontium crateriforme]|uniref:Origin recognition complex subunit 5 n=1 Tax=Acrodontium crateriforme TaxID=150365 RepID=A0AAQ3MBC1_9PEZI|nr:Hypothetical protein R9X50_00715200 [Acrodontium crateriforme]